MSKTGQQTNLRMPVVGSKVRRTEKSHLLYDKDDCSIISISEIIRGMLIKKHKIRRG